MSIIEITLWSLAAAAAITAMIAHYLWGELRKELAAAVDSAADYRARWKNAETAAETQRRRADKRGATATRSLGIVRASIKTIARLAADLASADKRARVHCGMIARQRKRADALWAKYHRAEIALTDALENRIRWSTCPACGRLVAAKGYPSPVGECRFCGCTFTESAICDVDPISQESDLIDTTRALYQAAKRTAKRTAKALAAAVVAFPDIVNPPAVTAENHAWKNKADAAQYAATIEGRPTVHRGPGKPPTPPRPAPVLPSPPARKSKALYQAWTRLLAASSAHQHNRALLDYQETHRQVHGKIDPEAMPWT